MPRIRRPIRGQGLLHQSRSCLLCLPDLLRAVDVSEVGRARLIFVTDAGFGKLDELIAFAVRLDAAADADSAAAILDHVTELVVI